MRGPIDVTRELLASDVLHEIVHLPRRIDDSAELPEALGVPGATCVGVRLYEAGDGLVAALIPADRAAATSALALAAGARAVRTARPERVSAVTDSHPGLVSPVGLPAGVAVFADEAVRDQEVVFTTTGDASTVLKIRAADLLALVRATVTPLVEPGVVVAVPRHTAEEAWRGAAPLART